MRKGKVLKRKATTILMAKQIALFLDGTRNTDRPTGGAGTTNVHKLFLATIGVKKYVKGVAADSNDLVESIGGLGTSKKIRLAYSFLTKNYKRGDSIYIFGFSRGAFAARSLAGFAFRVGLLLDGNDSRANLDRAWKAYTRPSPKGLRELRKILHRISRHDVPVDSESDLPVHFIGVWDTVAATKLAFQNRPPEARLALFHRHELARNVNHGRHALALHEGRRVFEPLLFSKKTAPLRQTLEQRWFSGSHADVGGGYAHQEAGLASASLEWMVAEALTVGFQCDNQAIAQAYAGSGMRMHQEGRSFVVEKRIRPALAGPSYLSIATRQTFSLSAGVVPGIPALRPQYPSWALARLQATDSLALLRASQSPVWGP